MVQRVLNAVGPWGPALATPLAGLGGLASGAARERGRGLVLLSYELHGGAPGLGLGLCDRGVGGAVPRLMHGCARVRRGADSMKGLMHGLGVVDGVAGQWRSVAQGVLRVVVLWPGVGGLGLVGPSWLWRTEGRHRWVRCILGRLVRLPGLGGASRWVDGVVCWLQVMSHGSTSVLCWGGGLAPWHGREDTDVGGVWSPAALATRLVVVVLHLQPHAQVQFRA